jgi:hypothetical protein
VGPPGPGLAAGLTRVIKLSWDPRTALTLPAALDVLRELSVEFSTPLDAARAEGFVPFVAWVRCQSFPGAGQAVPPPLVALRGKPGLAGATFTWALGEDPATVTGLLRAGGLVFLDLDCDYLVDANGQPVSGSAGALVNSELGGPGGIFRAWLHVLAG